MLKINKIKTELDVYDIELIDDNNIFRIMYGGNGDLYWFLHDKNNFNIFEKCKNGTFVITEENLEIYELFNNLYNNVKNCNIYEIDNPKLKICELKQKNGEEYKGINKPLKHINNYDLLFNNNIITWHNDDSIFDGSNTVNIVKEGNEIILNFVFNEKNSICNGNSIRFKHSDSRYSPFNLLFIELFNKLQNYDINNYQKNLKKI